MRIPLVLAAAEPAPGREGVRHLRRHDRNGGAKRRAGAAAGIAGFVLGSLLPLFALALAAFMARSPLQVGAGPGLEPRALARLREAHATRRIESAIEAYRLTEGHWPDVFRDLPKEGYLDASALAAPEGRPYYSAIRDDGVVFLAPEH